MQWFRNLKIAHKLAVASLGTLVLTASLGLFSLFELRTLDHASDELTNKWSPATRTILEIKAALLRYRTFELQHALSNAPADYDDYENQMARQMDMVRGLMARYQEMLASEEVRDSWRGFQQELDSYETAAHRVAAISRSGDLDGARRAVRGESRTHNFAAADEISRLVQLDMAGAAAARHSAEQAYLHARILIFATLGASLLLGGLLAWRIGAVIAAPLGAAVSVAERVAQGDLSTTIEGHSDDETGHLLAALRSMNERLRHAVGEVRHGADAVAGAATELAEGNHELAARTAQQAAALEETAATMGQLTESVRQNADHAQDASVVAASTASQARDSGTAVAEIAQTMERITEAAGRMHEIVQVIDGIAFQTNLLALNASVEAARAGTHGRSFAVVASEVRQLAQRSAGSAREIRLLIEDSIRKVGEGAARVQRAGVSIESTIAGVSEVSALLQSISGAAREQRLGIEQVNSAVAELGVVTQRNVALAEESSHAMQGLQEQADLLARAVGTFRLAPAPQARRHGGSMIRPTMRPVLT